jgi:hypothetical protein
MVRLVSRVSPHPEEEPVARPRFVAALTVLAVLVTACTPDRPAPPAPTPPTAARPVLGAWHALVYHDRLESAVLVNGGPERGKPADEPLELWRWDGAAWHRLDEGDGPPWRNYAAVAYDTDRQVLVLHGGLQGRDATFDETWEWDGRAWRRAAGPGPGPREGAAMAYDPSRKETVLVGGGDAAGPKGDTWGWNGTAWRRLATTGPDARFPGPLVFDEVRAELVLYGGHVLVEPGARADTWLWNGRAWRLADRDSPPGRRVNAAAAFHRPSGQVVMVGGSDLDTNLDELWGWDGRAWRRLPEAGLPRRQASGLAYDARRDRLVLTGGLDRPGTEQRLQDVWEWDGTTFTRRDG